MNTEFDDLSRKAATGTLTSAERASLDAYLRDHPERRADLEWDAAFHAKLEEKIDAMPVMPGWERTQRALRETPELGAADVRRAWAKGPGILDRLSDWFAATLGFSINAQAIAVALVLVQAGVIGTLAWQDRETGEGVIRAGTQDPTPRGPMLRVSFRQDVREAQLRSALADIGGEIIGGPGQIGIYLVRVKDGDLKAAASKLRAGGTTELVEVVEARK